MPLIWGSWLIAALFLGLFGGAPGDLRWMGEIVVILHSAVVLMVILHCYRRSIATILGLSLVVRVVLVFWDLNFDHIFSLPNSGADSEVFFQYAVAVANDPSLVFENAQGGMFAKTFGLLFWVTGVHRVFGQYTNVLLGLSIVLLVEAMLTRFPVSEKRQNTVTTLAALLPNTLIISSIFLRETIIAFLIAVSIYFFVRWFRDGTLLDILVSLIALLAASTFHAGVIAVGVGYMIVVVFYWRDEGRFGIGRQSFGYAILFAFLIFVVVAENPDIFLGKFETFDSQEDLLISTNRRAGGSQYLAGLTVDSYADMIAVGPLRAIYFLGSPMPWDARGIVDVFTLLTDSLFYLGVPVLFFRIRKKLGPRERQLGWALVVIILTASLVFGAGVSNAGTAVRHRLKLFPLFAVLFAISRAENTPKPNWRKLVSPNAQG